MKSLRELYKIGRGPSSSHTMGPERAARLFAEKYPEADSFTVTLYGSLAKTGKGHMTDSAVREALHPKNATIVFDMDTDASAFYHPNTMELSAWRDGEQIGAWRVYSIGGGSLRMEGEQALEAPEVYALQSFAEIKAYCMERNIRICDYVELSENGILDYLAQVWLCMQKSIQDGLAAKGFLPGPLQIQKKAGFLYRQKHMDESAETRENRIVCAYAYAVSEQNASCREIVTAPTCGSCGVLPAVLKYMQEKRGFSDEDILRALATAGIVGNLIKTNASISGAECGCQAEIGSACSMAAAALGELFGMSLDQIEYAAEIAMEHHLGLTCDPIKGLVQIPCIERNAVAAMRAINAVSLANFLTDTRKISFDMVVETMYQTGKDMSKIYRETSEGGLAKLYR